MASFHPLSRKDWFSFPWYKLANVVLNCCFLAADTQYVTGEPLWPSGFQDEDVLGRTIGLGHVPVRQEK